MNISVLQEHDMIIVSEDQISLIINSEDISYDLGSVRKVSMITTDLGPDYDDFALMLVIRSDVFIIPSEHPMFDNFLFAQLSKIAPIDYDKVIEAADSTNSGEFIIYYKPTSSI